MTVKEMEAELHRRNDRLEAATAAYVAVWGNSWVGLDARSVPLARRVAMAAAIAASDQKS